MSDPTAAATFEINVHGVVVHTSRSASSSTSGNRTYTDASVMSSYPSATSWLDSAVPHRPQYGTTLNPS